MACGSSRAGSDHFLEGASMSEFRYGLGLDQGVGSIGWAVLRLDSDGQAVGIERMGTHLFEAGTEGDIARGKDESRAGPRRMARQNRKKYRRTWVRKRRLLKLLQGLGLMPAGDVTTPEVRDALLKGLDAELRTVWEGADADHRMRQLLPYRLRAAGLEQVQAHRDLEGIWRFASGRRPGATP